MKDLIEYGIYLFNAIIVICIAIASAALVLGFFGWAMYVIFAPLFQ